MSGDEAAARERKIQRVEPSLSDIFEVSVETNKLVKATREEFGPRIEAAEAKLTEHASTISDLEKRVTKIEGERRSKSRSPSPVKQPSTAEPVLYVIGQSGQGPRPEVSKVAELIEFKEQDVKITWPGSKVVQICSTAQAFPMLRHRLAGTGLWIDTAKSPSELAATGELRKIAAWFQTQPEAAGTAHMSSTQVTTREGHVVASLSSKRDKVVWGLNEFKIRWLSR